MLGLSHINREERAVRNTQKRLPVLYPKEILISFFVASSCCEHNYRSVDIMATRQNEK